MTDRILERVRKLLALANDDAASEGERDNALRMAHNTLAKHQLDMIDVDKHVRDKDDPRGLFEMEGWNIPWCRVVRAAVAHLFSVKYFHCKINATKGRHSFVGRESQATTAMLMGDWIVKALLREADQRYGHRLTRGGRSFGEGAGAKLWQRVHAMVKTKEQEYGGGFALALVSELKQNEQFALELWGELGKAKARKFDVDASAYVSGKDHAETISLNTQLQAEKAAKELTMKKPIRFKDVPVGALFKMKFAGGKLCTFAKLSTTECETPKLNSPGTVVLKLDPELNEDDCTLVD